MSEAGTALDARELTARCEQFVFAEAELLDQRRLEDWLALFAEDGVYWLPISESQNGFGDGLNIIFDDRARLADRIARLHTGLAFSDEPHGRTSHVIGGVRVLAPAEAAAVTGGRPVAPDEYVVAGRSLIGRLRPGQLEAETMHARVTWVLRAEGDSFSIVMKRIDLLNAGEPLPVLAVLL